MRVAAKSLSVLLMACTTACAGAKAPDAGDPSGQPDRPPCAVSRIVEQRCVECHGSVRHTGAPMPLLRASDFRALRRNQPVGTAVLARITNIAQPMPPKPQAPLAQPQIEILRVWIEAGAPDAHDGCAITDTSIGTGSHGSGGMSAIDAGPGSGASGGSGGGGQAGAPAIKPGAGKSSAVPNAWPMYGGDLTNSRANLHESLISPANVGTLVRKWQFDGPSISATPVIANGVVYLPGWNAKVYALSADDGSEVWTATLPALIDSSLAVTDTQIFASDGHGAVHALERSSGTLQWSQRVDPHPEAHLWSSPIYIADANLIVVGVASYEEVVFKDKVTFRGSLVALDATTGVERWRVYTTAADASEGPGVAIWGTASVDTRRKLLYVGTGNNYAAPGSPLSDSLLAIDYEQGSLVWHSQFLADDIFALGDASGPDYDIGSTANLFTAGGKDLVGIGVKSGLYAAFDRDTGTREWSAQVSPGGIFGGLISAPAYADGTIFAASNDPDVGETVVAALDAASGAIAWKKTLPMQSFSGVAYANQIAFVGTMAGTLAAFDATNGDMLWSDAMPDVAGSPAIADGTLFVPFGYQLTLADGEPGVGGMIAYGLP